MSVINATPLLAAAGGDYQIGRSVRLRKSASAYFNRTPSSATNQQKFTFSAWVKLGDLSTMYLMSAGSATSAWGYLGVAANAMYFTTNAGTSGVQSSNLLRDPSAWYHLVWAIDTTQATAANRVLMYVNGAVITSFQTASYPSQNSNTYWNGTSAHALGRLFDGATGYHTDGYLTEVNFIDGQALTPSSFGETDSITGVWKPKKYAGTYGTNGFYLNFSDNSAATAAAIGKDNSGNGNNWTPNNISVTAGVTYDSMLDVPTLYADGGNGRGNYAVINPISTPAAGGVPAIADGNLRMVGGTANSGGAWSTIALPTSGQFYAESTVEFTTGSYQVVFGIADNNSTSTVIDVFVGDTSANQVRVNGSNVQAFTPASGDVFSFAVDCGTGVVVVRRNNTTIYTSTSLAVADKNFFFYRSSNGGQRVNFGQRPFAYTPPTGFKALNTQNLPDATIKKGNQYFDATTYTGNGTDGRTVGGLGFQPDLVWVKNRNSASYYHTLVDAVRGADKNIWSNTTAAEQTADPNGSIGSFVSDGFTAKAGSTSIRNTNGSAEPYVAWQWKESASAGFDIVTFTAPASGNFTVNHSLGVAPKMVVIKSRDNAVAPWYVYHASLAADNYLRLNATNATALDTGIWGAGMTSSVIGSQVGKSTVANSATVAYCFSEVAGFSKFGSYTGNGSADGTFVYCGFRPRFVMTKRTDTTGSWLITDSSRDIANINSARLYPNLSNAEGSSAWMDFTSNGFKFRSVDENTSGGTYIFAAFAESPFKNSLAR